MRKILLILIISVFASASNVVMAWDVEQRTWVAVWEFNGKKEACVIFRGGVCGKKEDVTKRFTTEQTSTAPIYVIKEK